MYSLKRFASCLGFVLALTSVDAATESSADYIHTKWNAEDGLPQNSVKHVLQTRDGYLWIGTPQGLARFDGLKFTNFRVSNTPGLPHNNIMSLTETSDGTLWVATAGGLACYRDGVFKSFGREDGVIPTSITGLCVAPDGSLWIGIGRTITRWAEGKFHKDITWLSPDGINALTTAGGALWVSTRSALHRWDGNQFTAFSASHGLPNRGILSVREDSQGRVLAVTQSGLLQLEGEKFLPWAHDAKVAKEPCNAVLLDRSGGLWIGTIEGLYRYADGELKSVVDASGKAQGVNSLFEDREGCLWMGNSSGLHRFTSRRGYTLSLEDGVKGRLTVAVHQTRDGDIWISSWAGGMARFRNGAITQYQQGAPLSNNTVTCIYEAPDGTIWLGNRGSSIDRLEGDRVSTFVFENGVASSRPVTCMYQEPGGDLYVGISRRGLLRLRDGKLEPVAEASAFAAETVSTLHRTADGRLLAATGKGIFQRDSESKWELVALPGAQPAFTVFDIAEESDGTMWFATSTQGLVRLRNNTLRTYSLPEGMVDEIIFSVLDDGQGFLWVTSPRGIARYRKTEFVELDRGAISHLNRITFGRTDGLLSGTTDGGNSRPLAIRLADGRLLFATDDGAAFIDPRDLQVNAQPPPVIIESATADDEPLAIVPGQPIVAPPGTNRLEFRYTALSLMAPQLLRFRYQLEGSDPEWIEAGQERNVRYTHLAPGNYTFQVLACNNDGVWNTTGTTLAVIVQPQFYQTLWFRVTAVGASLGLLISLVGLRVRHYRRKQQALAQANAELDQRVRERTAELQQREILFRLIFEHAPVGLSWNRSDLGKSYHFNSAFRRILNLPSETAPDNSLVAELVHPDDVPRQKALHDLLLAGKSDSYFLEQRFVRKDGNIVWGQLGVAVIRDQQRNIIQTISILEDVTARKAAEQELVTTHKRLMEASRMAGMAEVATGVLHNVGNVLNSVNVTANLLADRFRDSKVTSIYKVNALLREHTADLPAFFANDPRAAKLVPYLENLANALDRERTESISDLSTLLKGIDHVKDVIWMQQSYASVAGVVEPINMGETIDDALKLSDSALVRHNVTVERQFAPTTPARGERHKVLQILVNLISNAKKAMDCKEPSTRRLTLRVESSPNRDNIVVRVIDNGVGIAPENLTNIFSHGFTTRKDGHGFGLHSSALAAMQMGGSLVAQSEGPGRGATFVLELPCWKETPAGQKSKVVAPDNCFTPAAPPAAKPETVRAS